MSLKKAVQNIKTRCGVRHDPDILALLDTAECVLAVGSKMPEKDLILGRCSCDGWNTAIENCTLAVAGLLDRERLVNRIKSFTVNNLNIGITTYGAEQLADAIIESIRKEAL